MVLLTGILRLHGPVHQILEEDVRQGGRSRMMRTDEVDVSDIEFLQALLELLLDTAVPAVPSGPEFISRSDAIWMRLTAAWWSRRSPLEGYQRLVRRLRRTLHCLHNVKESASMDVGCVGVRYVVAVSRCLYPI